MYNDERMSVQWWSSVRMHRVATLSQTACVSVLYTYMCVLCECVSLCLHLFCLFTNEYVYIQIYNAYMYIYIYIYIYNII